MARRVSMLLVVFFVSQFAFAQVGPIDPPVVGRPDDFSGIVGKYSLEVRAEPAVVNVEEPITLQVRIIGNGPTKYEPKRANLRVLPDLTADFYVENVPDEDRVLKQDKTWIFVYRLRPKHVNVREISSIKLVYYDSVRAKFQTSFLEEPIAIKVTPKSSDVEKLEVSLVAPPTLFQVAADDAVLAPVAPVFAFSTNSLVMLLLAPPLICVVWAMAWRRLNPSALDRQARLRGRAAGRAIAILQAGGDFPWRVVQAYLTERFDLHIDDPTPADVAAFLKQIGFTKALFADGFAFFQACDAIRYARSTTHAKGLNDHAIRLICALEADPCAR